LRILFSQATTLPYVLDLPVLGVCVRFEASHPALLDAVDTAYGYWAALRHDPRLSPARARVRLSVHAHPDTLLTPVQPRETRVLEPDLFLVANELAVGVSDAAAREAVAFVAPAALHDHARLRALVLDPLVLFTITRADRHPLHASAIARGNAALLLAGPSGAGKSTLSYAALRAGLNVLADDAVYAQLDPVLRIWALSGDLHLAPESARHFPELSLTTPQRAASGKLKLVIPRIAARAPAVVDYAGICVLARAPGPREPVRITAQEVITDLATTLDPGFDRFNATTAGVLERVAQRGAWRLPVAGAPESLIPHIEQMLDDIVRIS
jgi:hypothetical protein